MLYNILVNKRKGNSPKELKMIDTISLKKAVMEIANEKGAQYAEDCVKGMLKLKKITVSQYAACMEVVYA